RQRQNEQQFCTTLDRLSTLEDYAKPLMTAAIKDRFGLDVDVTPTWQFHALRARIDQSFLSASRHPVIQANKAQKSANQIL
ncbi:hypothetical protein, partial [Pseudomonas syringae group genomosp. 7]|uniref:hypothetical protein n=1 Tax=Pseudomonas syringae group genomosp. 7 TaxID=251699 RepID=UPI00376FCFDB